MGTKMSQIHGIPTVYHGLGIVFVSLSFCKIDVN